MSNPNPPFKVLTVMQDIIDGVSLDCPDRLPTIRVPEPKITTSDVYTVFNHARPLGISPGYDQTGRLVAISIADKDNCRIVEFARPPGGRQVNKQSLTPPKSIVDGRKLLQDTVLCRPAGDIYAFDLADLAMSLYSDINLRIARGVDIQSAFPTIPENREPLYAIESCIGKEPDPIHKIKINVKNIENLFSQPVYNPGEDQHTIVDLAVRAWVSQFLPGYGNGAEVFDKVEKINTEMMDTKKLELMAKLATDSLKMEQRKPTQATHKFTQSMDSGTSQLRLNSTEFNSRFRGEKTIRMTVIGPHGEFHTKGQINQVSGRASDINTGSRELNNKEIVTVTSIGRDSKTRAEAHRSATILKMLQGKDKLLEENPWVQNIFAPINPDGPLVWPEEWSTAIKPIPTNVAKKKPLVNRPLNGSQQVAVNSMLSEIDDHRILLIQGPPGTGKTSVIASFVDFAVNMCGRTGIWLVAQSNVAVKNIAEKLISSNFTAWKLLVSKDFHFDWHEHLYEKVATNIIRSDAFKSASKKANLADTRVMLCTVSMLSNDGIKGFLREVPFKTLVVDEASQIEIGNYVSIFSKFKWTLRKVCFIGDDKQLPPFGQEEQGDLQSIFEVPHLNQHVRFLDTQYRMPPQIGDIISKEVYDSKLKSNPLHPVTEKTTACYFLNVPSKEKKLPSQSLCNEAEAKAIIMLAKKLQEQGKNYRIITPYDGQRNYIEECMRDEGLEWGDKCFNVDSFQGNEDDYIIISVVRSRALGFLGNLRRTNVMLTRCKKGMFIVSSLQFLQGIGSQSLVGQLFNKMNPPVFLTPSDVEKGDF